jgi:hypothetical protein
MTSNYVQLPSPANSTGLKMNTAEGMVNTVTVENQIASIGDPNTLTQVAAVSAPTDNQSTSLFALLVQAVGLLWDGTSTGFDRWRSASATNMGLKTASGAALVTRPGEWVEQHNPLSPATLATCTIAAGGSGDRHVCTSISYSLIVGSTAQTAITVVLRDGASGTGTILWQITLGKAANEAMTVQHLDNLNIIGSVNSAMTLEFSGAGVTNSYESVAMTGYDTV